MNECEDVLITPSENYMTCSCGSDTLNSLIGVPDDVVFAYGWASNICEIHGLPWVNGSPVLTVLKIANETFGKPERYARLQDAVHKFLIAWPSDDDPPEKQTEISFELIESLKKHSEYGY